MPSRPQTDTRSAEASRFCSLVVFLPADRFASSRVACCWSGRHRQPQRTVMYLIRHGVRTMDGWIR
jgi:hypothetical protein